MDSAGFAKTIVVLRTGIRNEINFSSVKGNTKTIFNLLKKRLSLKTNRPIVQATRAAKNAEKTERHLSALK